MELPQLLHLRRALFVLTLKQKLQNAIVLGGKKIPVGSGGGLGEAIVSFQKLPVS